LISVAASTEHEQACIAIKDTGIGIPEHDLQYVFDRLYRAKNAGTIEGSGLGLSIAKKIVELHNGSITVSSTLHQGTRLTIMIPRSPQITD